MDLFDIVAFSPFFPGIILFYHFNTKIVSKYYFLCQCYIYSSHCYNQVIMGQTVPVRQLFVPHASESIQDEVVMTKVWTFLTAGQAQTKVNVLTQIQRNQQLFECKFDCYEAERTRNEREWKVVVEFQYSAVSLRQQLINRKRNGGVSKFYTEKELSSILNLLGFFIFQYNGYLCNHSDILANIFVSRNGYKICHPEFIQSYCPFPSCDQLSLKAKIVDSVLQLMLMEKVVRASQKHRQRAQNLYSHAPWIFQFLEALMGNTDVMQLSHLSNLVHQNPSKRRLEVEEGIEQIKKQKGESKGSSWNIDRQEQSQLRYVNSFKLEDHRRSFSEQVDGQPNQGNNRLYENREYKQGQLLEGYQRQLAESIGEQDESFLISNPNYTGNIHEQTINEEGALPQEGEIADVGNIISVENIPQQDEDNASIRNNKSMIHPLPATIFEEENQNCSQESKPNLEFMSSKSMTVLEEEGCRYEGQLFEGKKNGKGIFRYANGVYYQGEWRNDQMHGVGTLFLASGKPYYIGQWKYGNFDGHGKFFNDSEQAIEGGFNYGDFNEIGRKWSCYQGQFKQDKKHGEGVLTLSNGEIFSAVWVQDVINGKGIFHGLDGRTVHGIWLQNMLYHEQLPGEL